MPTVTVTNRYRNADGSTEEVVSIHDHDVLQALREFGPAGWRIPPLDEPWEALMARLRVPGQVHQITDETYDYFLNVLPPRWMGAGFLFAEGEEPLRYFFTGPLSICFCRQLTWEESRAVCAALREAA